MSERVIIIDKKHIVDNSKAKEILGLKPKKTIEDSISVAYSWKKNSNKEFINA